MAPKMMMLKLFLLAMDINVNLLVPPSIIPCIFLHVWIGVIMLCVPTLTHWFLGFYVCSSLCIYYGYD
jgi:hypothetical protein